VTINIRLIANRHLIVLKPREPFLKWIVEADPDSPKPRLRDFLNDLDGILIPEAAGETEADVKRWVNKHWQLFFEQMLNDWYVDETLWPKNRSAKLFNEWVEIQYHSMVWDMADDDIAYEVFDDDEDEGDQRTVH
jgi:hypothetical protein